MAFRKLDIARLITLSVLLVLISLAAHSQSSKRPFTVADDIGFSHFVSSADAYCWFGKEGIQFSPNGEYFSVLTAHGRLDLNQVEESLRFYRTSDVTVFVSHSGSPAPEPVWTVTRTSKEESITGIRWLADSSGVALIENTEGTTTGRINKIELLNLSSKTAELIATDVAHFERVEMSGRDHYVYVAEDEVERRAADARWEEENRSPAIALTGSNLGEAVMRDDPQTVRSLSPIKQHLWEVSRDVRSEVKYNGSPISTSDFDPAPLLFSPDGHSLLVKQNVKDVPESWEKLYPPPYASSEHRIHAHGSASEYVVLDLQSGAVRHLTDAPIGDDAGWWAGDGEPSWSSDGQAILLPGTFIKSKDDSPSRPCMAVFDVSRNTASCIEKLKGHINEREFEKGYRHFMSAQFVGGDKNHVEMTFFYPIGEVTGTVEYRREANGDWKLIGERDGYHYAGPNGLDLIVKQEWDQPPLLMASDGKTGRVLLDPNPQFKNIDLAQTRVYEWKDKEGRSWTGGLYMPARYEPGKRYPLVIQTHGFTKSAFLPSGSYPTAFAARELAAAGVAVLQVGGGEICGDLGPDEAPCEVSGFDSGARQLAADGIVDLEKVGYIGFSRSCWYGMDMLTNASFALKASLLADGIAEPYWLYLVFGVDTSAEIGKPFGENLQKLVKTAPEFNLDKVRTPLLLTSEAKFAALEMYQPYASLRYLKKPVELVMINTREHVITNPVERLASQGLTVDWFRFWLQGYEDPDPAKAEQYKRWRELKKMQTENEKKSAEPPPASN